MLQITTAKLSTAVLTGATDIGAAIADADLFLVDDGAGGTLRKTAASRLKTYIGANTPAFSARLNSAQNIANNTFVKIAFNGELFDTDSAFASNKFTVPSGEGGNYFFNYGIQYLAYAANRGISSFRKNGTEIQTSEISPLTSSTNPTITGALSLNLSAGDYVEVFVYQNSGSAQDIRGSSSELFTYFGGYKLI